MRWEELTGDRFAEAVEECGGGCAIPLSVVERHGRHLPMGTDTYLGRETLLTTGAAKFARWRKVLFSFLSRNSRPPTAFFNLPPNRVVELGLQIEV